MMTLQVQYHLKDLMTELQQTNLEKTLLAWCRQNSQVNSAKEDQIFMVMFKDEYEFDLNYMTR